MTGTYIHPHPGPLVAAACALLISGCATVAPELVFDDVAANVAGRIDHQVVWDVNGPHDLEARDRLRDLMSRELTMDAAVQVTLLNNKDLQAQYADLGISQAALVQAGTLKNPVLDGAVTWFNDAGGTPNVAFGIAWSFIDLFYIPLRQSVAESELEEVKIRIAAEILRKAAETRAAFVGYVASMQEAELLAQVVRASKANATAAASLRKAGNITALQFEQQKNILSSARLDLAKAEGEAAEARETLNVLMGLTGGDTEWTAPMRLPEIADYPPDTRRIEARAIEASLEVEAGRQRLTTLGRRYNLVRKSSLVPDLEKGIEYEREVEVEEPEVEEGEAPLPPVKTIRRAIGPTFEFEIPIFDRGEARKAGALMEILKAENQLWALAVKLRSVARLTRARLLLAHKTAAYYREALLPESQRILAGTQRDYNAMQEDVFRLLSAKRQQIAVARQYIQALKAYWLAHSGFMQLMNGTMPDGGGDTMQVASAGAGGAGDEGGH